MQEFSYVGICDFRNKEHALRSAKLFERLCNERGIKNRKLMIGVMLSFSTLTGAPSDWSMVWPKNEEVGDIFVDHPFAFNTLHYADYDGDTRRSDLVDAIRFGGQRLNAIQLDMVWPSVSAVVYLKNRFPNLKIVLQVNTKALLLIDNNPILLVNRLMDYGKSLDYVLLDKSYGKGVPMDAKELLPFALSVAEHLPHIGIAGAGGLGPMTVDLIKPLVEAIPTISWDAQSKLRPSGSTKDPMVEPMGNQYLYESVGLLKPCL